MANGAPRGDRNRPVKRPTRAPLAFRLLGRIGATLVALVIFALAGIQFARVIHQNVALAQDLSATRSDISALQARKRWQLRELRRLADPEGAVPDIHERLRLVRPNEAIIFVSPAPSPAS
jgi:cell division protein FtsB